MTRLQFVGAALTVAMAASLGACNPPAPAKAPIDTAKIGDAVKADVTQMLADYNAHDATKLTGHYASDGVTMFHGSPNVTGSAAIEADAKRAFAADPTVHVTLSDETVDVAASGDLAVFHATAVATFTDTKTKKPRTETTNYLAGYRPQADGAWKQEWSVVSDVGPPPAAAAPAPKG